ncbi:hypothetical protein GCM10010302_26430 [Streptomyces polychromogenes]|uniref:Uncharacterized protein n=1 Tax=Streptomyces polychromogenes TaxID=67342 RepID=A0ABN0VCM2_9ACTN
MGQIQGESSARIQEILRERGLTGWTEVVGKGGERLAYRAQRAIRGRYDRMTTFYYVITLDGRYLDKGFKSTGAVTTWVRANSADLSPIEDTPVAVEPEFTLPGDYTMSAIQRDADASGFSMTVWATGATAPGESRWTWASSYDMHAVPEDAIGEPVMTVLARTYLPSTVAHTEAQPEPCPAVPAAVQVVLDKTFGVGLRLVCECAGCLAVKLAPVCNPATGVAYRMLAAVAPNVIEGMLAELGYVLAGELRGTIVLLSSGNKTAWQAPVVPVDGGGEEGPEPEGEPGPAGPEHVTTVTELDGHFIPSCSCGWEQDNGGFDREDFAQMRAAHHRQEPHFDADHATEHHPQTRDIDGTTFTAKWERHQYVIRWGATALMVGKTAGLAFRRLATGLREDPEQFARLMNTRTPKKTTKQAEESNGMGRGSMAPRKIVKAKVGDILFATDSFPTTVQLMGHFYTVNLLAGSYTITHNETRETLRFTGTDKKNICRTGGTYFPTRPEMKKAVLADAVARGERQPEPVVEEQSEPVAEEPTAEEKQARRERPWEFPIDARGRELRVGDLVTQAYPEIVTAYRIERLVKNGAMSVDAVAVDGDGDGKARLREHCGSVVRVTEEQMAALPTAYQVEANGHRGWVRPSNPVIKPGLIRATCVCMSHMEISEEGHSRKAAYFMTTEEAEAAWHRHAAAEPFVEDDQGDEEEWNAEVAPEITPGYAVQPVSPQGEKTDGTEGMWWATCNGGREGCYEFGHIVTPDSDTSFRETEKTARALGEWHLGGQQGPAPTDRFPGQSEASRVVWASFSYEFVYRAECTVCGCEAEHVFKGGKGTAKTAAAKRRAVRDAAVAWTAEHAEEHQPEDGAAELEPVAVFIVSARSNPTRRRVLWGMTRADAMKLCSDDRTASKHYMLCWTASEHLGVLGEDWEWAKDRGTTNAVIAELGVTVLDRAVLEQAAADTKKNLTPAAGSPVEDFAPADTEEISAWSYENERNPRQGCGSFPKPCDHSWPCGRDAVAWSKAQARERMERAAATPGAQLAEGESVTYAGASDDGYGHHFERMAYDWEISEGRFRTTGNDLGDKHRHHGEQPKGDNGWTTSVRCLHETCKGKVFKSVICDAEALLAMRAHGRKKHPAPVAAAEVETDEQRTARYVLELKAKDVLPRLGWSESMAQFVEWAAAGDLYRDGKRFKLTRGRPVRADRVRLLAGAGFLSLPKEEDGQVTVTADGAVALSYAKAWPAGLLTNAQADEAVKAAQRREANGKGKRWSRNCLSVLPMGETQKLAEAAWWDAVDPQGKTKPLAERYRAQTAPANMAPAPAGGEPMPGDVVSVGGRRGTVRSVDPLKRVPTVLVVWEDGNGTKHVPTADLDATTAPKVTVLGTGGGIIVTPADTFVPVTDAARQAAEEEAECWAQLAEERERRERCPKCRCRELVGTRCQGCGHELLDHPQVVGLAVPGRPGRPAEFPPAPTCEALDAYVVPAVPALTICETLFTLTVPQTYARHEKQAARDLAHRTTAEQRRAVWKLAGEAKQAQRRTKREQAQPDAPAINNGERIEPMNPGWGQAWWLFRDQYGYGFEAQERGGRWYGMERHDEWETATGASIPGDLVSMGRGGYDSAADLLDACRALGQEKAVQDAGGRMVRRVLADYDTPVPLVICTADTTPAMPEPAAVRDWFAPVVPPVPAAQDDDGPDYAAISAANRADRAQPDDGPALDWVELSAELADLRADLEPVKTWEEVRAELDALHVLADEGRSDLGAAALPKATWADVERELAELRQDVSAPAAPPVMRTIIPARLARESMTLAASAALVTVAAASVADTGRVLIGA